MCKSFSSTICTMLFRDKAPGQKECDDAIDAINQAIRDLNNASLSAMSQSLPVRDDNTMKGFQEKVIY